MFIMNCLTKYFHVLFICFAYYSIINWAFFHYVLHTWAISQFFIISILKPEDLHRHLVSNANCFSSKWTIADLCDRLRWVQFTLRMLSLSNCACTITHNASVAHQQAWKEELVFISACFPFRSLFLILSPTTAPNNTTLVDICTYITFDVIVLRNSI